MVKTIGWIPHGGYHKEASHGVETIGVDTTRFYQQRGYHEVEIMGSIPWYGNYRADTMRLNSWVETYRLHTTRRKPHGEDHGLDTTWWIPGGGNHGVELIGVDTTRWKQRGRYKLETTRWIFTG